MRIAACLAAGLVAASGAGSTRAEPGGILFSISGGGAAEISCRVVRDGVAAAEDHSGPLPVDLRFDAEAVSCAVTADRPITVEATSDGGNRSRARSSGGRMVVTVSR